MHIAAKQPGTKSAIVAHAIAIALVISAAAAPLARAGDYAHQCRSSGGDYTMSDEALYAVDPATGRETGKEIKYKVIQKVMLSRRNGYCISNKAPKGQNRFNYSGSTYAVYVSFRRGREDIKTFLICDMASSGLPAMYNCDREVKKLDWVYSR